MAAHVAPPITPPTPADPLEVLVLGDSLATHVGQQMSAQLANSKLVDVKTVWRNGTGLTNPAFFNWEAGARPWCATSVPMRSWCSSVATSAMT